jgi:hypothetical protein
VNNPICYTGGVNRTLWLDPQSEDDLIDASAIALQGFNRVAVKALQGVTWQVNLDALRERLGEFAGAGLAMDTWVVPTHDTWREALPLYRVLPGRLILDLEPGDGYWGDQSDPSPFLRARALPWQDRLYLAYDPLRLEWLGAFPLGFTGTMPFLREPSWTQSVPVTGHPIEPILSSESSGRDWLTILRDDKLGSEDGRTGFGIYRAPVLGLERLATLRGLA